MNQSMIQKEAEKEAYARLTVPSHVVQNHFSEHHKVDGYFENRDVPDFRGSDRLLKLDTVYGTIQMGYSPQKRKSFLFANIKTSILDSAPSRYQREIKEYQMASNIKTETANRAFTAKRSQGSAVILFKNEPLPWSRTSIAPYLRRVNMGALRKTMPFLDRAEELKARAHSKEEQRKLQSSLTQLMSRRDYSAMRGVRAELTGLSARQNTINALLYRKDTQQRLFFRRLNSVLDMQKHEMFAYYRGRALGGEAAKQEAAPPVDNPNREDQDD